MIPFFTKFPDLARLETRTLIIRGRADLPDGEYGLIEFYCDQLNCDCRRVMINVLTPATRARVWATISYGWETVEFYQHWSGSQKNAVGLRGAELDLVNRQTKYSSVLLRLFEEQLKDGEYLERLKRHYALFKKAVEAESGRETGQAGKKQ